MTNSNIVADDGRIFISGNMHNTIILYIGITSNSDVKDVASKNSTKPNRCTRAYFYVTDNHRIRSNKTIGIYFWNFIFKRQ